MNGTAAFTVKVLNTLPEKSFREFLHLAIYRSPHEPRIPFSIVDLPELQRYYVDWGRPGDLCIAARDTNKTVGLCWGRRYSEDQPGFGFIDAEVPELNIAVSVSYRNQGLGTLLIQTLENEYLHRGFDTLSLSVDKRNPAKRLYRRLGYMVQIERENDLILVKHLVLK